MLLQTMATGVGVGVWGHCMLLQTRPQVRVRGFGGIVYALCRCTAHIHIHSYIHIYLLPCGLLPCGYLIGTCGGLSMRGPWPGYCRGCPLSTTYLGV